MSSLSEIHDFSQKVDHTVLGPETTWEQVEAVISDAVEYRMNACIPPSFVSEVARSGLESAGTDWTPAICTVVGFPNGTAPIKAKVEAAKQAFYDGADEIDFVVNPTLVRRGRKRKAKREVEAVVNATPLLTKAILCVPVLSPENQRAARDIAAAGGADILKTSTGFHSDESVSVDQVERLAEKGPVKASGGIRSYEHALELLDAGAVRLGSSSGSQLVKQCSESHSL